MIRTKKQRKKRRFKAKQSWTMINLVLDGCSISWRAAEKLWYPWTCCFTVLAKRWYSEFSTAQEVDKTRTKGASLSKWSGRESELACAQTEWKYWTGAGWTQRFEPFTARPLRSLSISTMASWISYDFNDGNIVHFEWPGGWQAHRHMRNWRW